MCVFMLYKAVTQVRDGQAGEGREGGKEGKGRNEERRREEYEPDVSMYPDEYLLLPLCVRMNYQTYQTCSRRMGEGGIRTIIKMIIKKSPPLQEKEGAWPQG